MSDFLVEDDTLRLLQPRLYSTQKPLSHALGENRILNGSVLTAGLTYTERSV